EPRHGTRLLQRQAPRRPRGVHPLLPGDLRRHAGAAHPVPRGRARRALAAAGGGRARRRARQPGHRRRRAPSPARAIRTGGRGAARVTEDFLAVVEAKRFLGREFLTWLVWTLEEGDGRLEHHGDVVELRLGDRVVLTGTGVDKPRLTVAGT